MKIRKKFINLEKMSLPQIQIWSSVYMAIGSVILATAIAFIFAGLSYTYQAETVQGDLGASMRETGYRFITNFVYLFPVGVAWLVGCGFIFSKLVKKASSITQPNSKPSHNSLQANVTPTEDSLRLEYQLAQSMHNYYGNIIWKIAPVYLGSTLIGVVYGLQFDLPKIAFIPLVIILTALVISFYLSVKRWRDIVAIHLARCREIEVELGLKQHTLVYTANEKEVNVADQTIRVPSYTGWGVLQYTLFIVIGVGWGSIFRHEISDAIVNIIANL